MKFTNQKMDFEIPRAKLANYFFGNIIMNRSTLLSFSFPSELQSFDFELQKMTFNNVAMTYSFTNFLTLNNTYKKTGYFENYDFVSNLDVGIYRIKAGAYYSESLLDVKKVVLIEEDFLKLVDSNGNEFVDSNDNYFVQPI